MSVAGVVLRGFWCQTRGRRGTSWIPAQTLGRRNIFWIRFLTRGRRSISWIPHPDAWQAKFVDKLVGRGVFKRMGDRFKPYLKPVYSFNPLRN